MDRTRRLRSVQVLAERELRVVAGSPELAEVLGHPQVVEVVVEALRGARDWMMVEKVPKVLPAMS